MAKKTVASLQKAETKNLTKAIKMIKSPKTGSYSFKEEIITNDKVDSFFKGNN
jgi:hypothetical protein